MWLSVQVAAASPPEDPGTECGWDFFCHMQEWLKWAVCWLIDLMKAVLLTIIDALPDMVIGGLGDLVYFFNIAELWFPFSFGFKLAGAYVSFLVIFITVKFVLKLIPTIG